MNFTQNHAQVHELIHLPNISIVLEEALKHAGLGTPEALKLAGAEAAWHRLQQHGEHVSTLTLLALEGAIQGVHWRQLSSHRRCELMRFATRAAWLGENIAPGRA